MNDYDRWYERGHVAIVTGASKGLGRAVSRELARVGISLVIDARGAEALAEAERELAHLVPVVAVPGDIADLAHVHRLVESAEQRFGRIDLVINNASTIGRSPLPALDQLSPATFDRIFTTNVFAPLHLIQHALAIMRRGGGGTIVNVSSDAAVEAYAGWGGYGSAKAALEHMSRILAIELDGSGIGVIVADPGDMDTELHRLAVPDADAASLADPRAVAPSLLRAIAAPRGPFTARRAPERGCRRRMSVVFSFALPPANEATTAPERRGLERDGVRLLVTDRASGVHHAAAFRELQAFLCRGDLLVVNDSETIPAALEARGGGGASFGLHLSSRISAELWVAEPRERAVTAGERAGLNEDGRVTFLAPVDAEHPRLWYVLLDLPLSVDVYLARHGSPIRYRYVAEALPLAAYQTIFARVPGSAEMPSAGRPFSARVLDDVRAAGVDLAAISLHTGVSSAERHERPYREWFEVSPATAGAVNAARLRGGRVIAVGTTVVRALESAAAGGAVVAANGWTDLVVTRERGIRVVDALLTGFHEPQASHLDLLRAFAGDEVLESAYAYALGAGYLWHEFGDLHLLA